MDRWIYHTHDTIEIYHFDSTTSIPRLPNINMSIYDIPVDIINESFDNSRPANFCEIFTQPRILTDDLAYTGKKYTARIHDSSYSVRFNSPIDFDSIDELKAQLSKNGWKYLTTGHYTLTDDFEENASATIPVSDLSLPYVIWADTLVKRMFPYEGSRTKK